jgi:hypothetical protein
MKEKKKKKKMANEASYESFFEGMPIQWGDTRGWSGDFIRKAVVSAFAFYMDLISAEKAPPREYWEAIAQDPALFLWLQETRSDITTHTFAAKLIQRYLVAIFSSRPKEDKVRAAFVAIDEFLAHLRMRNWRGAELLTVLRALHESGLNINEGFYLLDAYYGVTERVLELGVDSHESIHDLVVKAVQWRLDEFENKYDQYEWEEDNNINLKDFFAALENIQPMRKSAYKTASAQAIRQALIKTKGDVNAAVKLVYRQ